MRMLRPLRLICRLRPVLYSLMLVYRLDADPLEEPGRFIPDPNAKPLKPSATAELNSAKEAAEKSVSGKSANRECIDCAKKEPSVVSANKSAKNAGAMAKGLEKSFLDMAQRMQFQNAMWDLNRNVKKIADDVRRGKIAPAAVPQIQSQLARTFREEAAVPNPNEPGRRISQNLLSPKLAGFSRGAVTQVVPPEAPVAPTPAIRDTSNVSGTYATLEEEGSAPKAAAKSSPTYAPARELAPKVAEAESLPVTSTITRETNSESHAVLIYSKIEKESGANPKNSKTKSLEKIREPNGVDGETKMDPGAEDKNASEPTEIIDLDEEDPTIANEPLSPREINGNSKELLGEQAAVSEKWWKPIRISRKKTSVGEVEEWSVHPTILLMGLVSAFLVGMFSRPNAKSSQNPTVLRAVPSLDEEEDDTKPEIRLN